MTCHTWDSQDKSAVAILLIALSTQQAHLCDRACSDPVKAAGSIHRVDLCQSCSQSAVCRRLQLRVVKWDAFKATDKEEGKVKLLNLILKGSGQKVTHLCIQETAAGLGGARMTSS